jgi:hypothetical protein
MNHSWCRELREGNSTAVLAIPDRHTISSHYRFLIRSYSIHAEEPMRRILGATMAALALIVLMATPAFAATITKSVAIGHGVLTCTITYTELNGNAQIDTTR